MGIKGIKGMIASYCLYIQKDLVNKTRHYAVDS